MYYAAVTVLMFIAPLVAIGIDAAVHHVPLGWALIGKWYVFWAVGVRLLAAGLKQVAQPRYTAEAILGIRGDDVLVVVRELGFANIAIGLAGVASLLVGGAWRTAAALTGGVFYALAGIQHAMQGRRNKLENVAMVSDLFAAALLLAWCAWALSG